MNLIKSTLIAAACIATLTGSSFAQEAAPTPNTAPSAAQKIVTVNLNKAFMSFYKTQDAQKNLNAMEATIKEKNEERLIAIKAIEKELADIQKKAQDAAVPQEQKNKLVEQFNLKQADYVSKEKERNEYVQRRLKTLETNKLNKRNEILVEILKVVQEKTAQGGYDLVLDSSADSTAGTKVLVISDPKLDLTDLVIKELNKDAPAGFDPNALAQPAATPAPAPEANDAE